MEFEYKDLKPVLEKMLQNGAIEENGINGFQIDLFVRFCRDKIAEFNGRAYHERNVYAMSGLHQALKELELRTEERKTRKVEGTEQE